MSNDMVLKLRINADTGQVVSEVNQASNSLNQLDGSSKKAGHGTNQLTRSLNETENQLSRTHRQSDILTSSLKLAAGAFAGVAVFGAGRELVNQAAQYQDMATRLNNLSGSAAAFAENEKYLIELSREHSKNLLTLSDSYTKVLVLEDAGIVTRTQGRKILEGMSNASAALGASNEQLKQSLFGMAQGFTAGTLRAEELNQVTEPLPGLLQKLDKAAGLTSGGFRKMVNEGQVTSEMFRDTLVTALEEYDGAAASLAGNISAQFTAIENARLEMARAFEQPISDVLSPVLTATASALQGIANNADTVITVIEAIAVLTAGRLVASLGAATVARSQQLRATRAQIDADKLAAIQTQKTAQVELAAAQAQITRARELVKATNGRKVSYDQLAAAKLRLTAAEKAHGQAINISTGFARKSSHIMRELSGAMGLLGGPLGLITMAGSALAYFALSGSEAEASADSLDTTLSRLSDTYKDMTENQLRNELNKLKGTVGQDQLGHEGLVGAVTLARHRVKLLQDELDFYRKSGRDISEEQSAELVSRLSAVDDATQALNKTTETRRKLQDQLNKLINPPAETKTENKGDDKKLNEKTQADIAKYRESLLAKETLLALHWQKKIITIRKWAKENELSEAESAKMISDTRAKYWEAAHELRAQKKATALREEQALELAQASGFASIKEQQLAAHQDRVNQISLQKQLEALRAQRETEILTAQGYESKEEQATVQHQNRLAQIKQNIATNALNEQRQREILLAQGYNTQEEQAAVQHQNRLAQIKQSELQAARSQELLAAQGFNSIAEQQEAEHQAALLSIRLDSAGQYKNLLTEMSNFMKASLSEQVNFIGSTLTGLADQYAQLEQNKLSNMRSSYQEESQTIDDASAKRQNVLDQQYERGQISEAEYNNRSKAIESSNHQHQDRLLKGSDTAYKKQQAQAKKAFKQKQDLGVAMALIHGAQGIMASWAEGPIMGAIGSAIIGAQTIMQISNIKSQKFSGGGSSLSSSGGYTPAATAAPASLKKAADQAQSPAQSNYTSTSFHAVNKNGGISFDLSGMKIEKGADAQAIKEAIVDGMVTDVLPAIREATGQGHMLYDEDSDQAGVVAA